MCNYPPGAQYDPNAPYNQVDLEPIDVIVTISCTLTKKCKVTLYDYEVEEDFDEDGGYCYPKISDSDLYAPVNEQVDFPGGEGWSLDDYEIIDWECE